jgi:hypothetical protein
VSLPWIFGLTELFKISEPQRRRVLTMVCFFSSRSWRESALDIYFFETRQKDLSFLLIKEKGLAYSRGINPWIFGLTG